MREQANLAIAMADVILFLTDIKQGVTAADREISIMLKKSGKPIVLVCNKADNFQKDKEEAYEFYNLGMGDPYPISATNALGIGDVLDKIYESFPENIEENKDEKLLDIWDEKLIDYGMKIYEYRKEFLEKIQKEENIEKIIIYITGAVKKEGVYELEEGSRISDAIEQAEGLKEEADTSNINLAYKLEDGMKIKIPTQKENKNTNIENNQETFITQNSGLETEQIQTNSQINEKKQEKININKANQEELETLSGIGPSIANKIIQYRKDNGNFKSIDDIKNVSGIGENKYNEIKNSITIK
mgnify:CR=1 FL=1